MAEYPALRHEFTTTIVTILERRFGDSAADIFAASPLLGYLNQKTRAANRGSKARASFANHYALYVIVEDYINGGFHKTEAPQSYSSYEGAKFSQLFRRQRELPFGAKLQNHALNSRLNDEFRKFYPTVGKVPIVRDLESRRYWVHEDLLLVTVRHPNGMDQIYNIAEATIDIIDAYVATKQAAFESFLESCRQISNLGKSDPEQASAFVVQQLQKNVDARLFEIVSYAVLKAKYGQETVWIGEERDAVVEEGLVLYKTGRTNANDGGIDFVMRPLGRFFQVTETIDADKYFLDIDKVQRFPITFVVKSTDGENEIRKAIRRQALSKYKIEAVVDSYMRATEDIINIRGLVECFKQALESGNLQDVMDEIMAQSKVEFNYND